MEGRDKVKDWKNHLNYDPINPLINLKNDGSWNLKLLKTKNKDLKFWISYVIARTFKRFYC